MNLNIDDIIDDLINGLTYRAIANKYGVKLSTLHLFVNKPEHSARANTALQTSSQTFEDEAERVLLEAERDSIEIQRAKELSQYYRWKAATRNPKKYSSKFDVTTDGDKITNLSDLKITFK